MARDDGTKGVLLGSVRAAGARLAADAGEQIEMLELPTRFSGKAADAVRALARGPGRPKGATGLQTRRLKEFLFARAPDPLQRLLEMASHTPASYAREFACELSEAAAALTRLWQDLRDMRYGKSAPLDDDGRAVPQFSMVIGGAVVGLAGSRAPWLYNEENQGVSGGAAALSHAAPSHEEVK